MLLHFIWSHAVKVCILLWKLVQVLRYNFLVLHYQTCMHMVHNLVLCSCHFIVEIPKIFGSLYNFSYSFLKHKYVPIYNFLKQGTKNAGLKILEIENHKIVFCNFIVALNTVLEREVESWEVEARKGWLAKKLVFSLQFYPTFFVMKKSHT